MNSNTTYDISKRNILKRMLRTAANYFGVKHIELLDPLAVLFIEALAEEIYTASAEINNIETRLLDTLSRLITPSETLLAHPAHCILHALPKEGQTEISNKVSFIHKDKKRSSNNLKSLTFHPLRNTIIHNGGIRYITFNGLLYQINSDQTKTLVSRSRNTIQPKGVWFGLELDETTSNLENLSFYIDFLGTSQKEEILQLLPYSIWKINGKQVSIRQGLHSIEDESTDETVKIFNELTSSYNLDNSIWNSYNKHFITISDSILTQENASLYPNELILSFPLHIFEDFTKPIIWIEVVFPLTINAAILDNMVISINAFPIVNKNRHTKTVEIHESLPIISVDTSDHESLLLIESVSDSEGRIYTELPFTDTDSDSFGTYSLRRGGYERYSKREMREYLLLLVKHFDNLTPIENEVIENEGEDSNNGTQQVHRLIKHIKDLISKSKERLEIEYYISIDNIRKDDVFFVKYNTTNCELGNDIKQYSNFDSLNNDLSLKASSLYSLSTTSGGKSTPSITDIENLQIKALTTQSMLVTDNDIIEYCMSNFRMIAQVAVSNGIMENPINKQELLYTKDVLLTLHRDTQTLFKERESELLKKSLQACSPKTFNYRIIIK